MPTLPRPDQIDALVRNVPEDQPIHMLNLLKFKERAEYADKRETQLSGAEAYGLYGIEVAKILEKIGARVIYSAPTNVHIIGDGDLPWDAVAIVAYPSKSAFLDMIASDGYQAIAVHREAGLAYQTLVQCTPTGSTP